MDDSAMVLSVVAYRLSASAPRAQYTYFPIPLDEHRDFGSDPSLDASSSSKDALAHFVREATLKAAAVIGCQGEVVGVPDFRIRECIGSHQADIDGETIAA